ncbi:MAG: RHS repeat-associated core domain-containing protein [Candidatus Kapaibacterium sp.]|nr:MAG: RHS repeat-associated core domain-containing protein [Candidatus Kapabacteria bacterium]
MVVSSCHTTYAPFGSVLSSTGTGQRTGYIGREADNETGLGNYGVRLYEPEYGRFMSVDVLWGEYEGWQAYQYALNAPLSFRDEGGMWVQAMNEAARDAIRNSVPAEFRSAIQFSASGVVLKEPLLAAARGQDVNSNVAILSRLAENEETIQVEVTHMFMSKNSTTGEIEEDSFDRTHIDAHGDVVYSYTNALTLAPTRLATATKLPVGAPTSSTGSFHVIIDSDPKTQFFWGSPSELVAHELYVHVKRALRMKVGKSKTTWHNREATDEALLEQADMEREDRRARLEGR